MLLYLVVSNTFSTRVEGRLNAQIRSSHNTRMMSGILLKWGRKVTQIILDNAFIHDGLASMRTASVATSYSKSGSNIYPTILPSIHAYMCGQALYVLESMWRRREAFYTHML